MKKLTFSIFLVILVSCIPENKPPECEFVTPEEGSEYVRGDDIEVYVEATDEDGEIDEVRFYLDGTGISSMRTFPFSYTIETVDLEVGTHSIKAEVFDDHSAMTEIDVSFNLTAGLPEVETLQPALIAENAVIAGGTIIDDGGGTILEAGVLWGKVPYTVTGKQEVSAEVIDDSFITTLTNLEYTTYYITAFAENESGRVFGDELRITVPVHPPSMRF